MGNLLTFQLTPLALPQVIASVLCLMAAGFIWPLRREAPGARWLLIVLGGAILWSFAGALEFLAATLAGKLFWTQVSYVGIVIGPVSLFHFSYVHTRGGATPPRFASAVVVAAGAIILLSAFTNSLHGWHWPEIVPVQRDGRLFAFYERGPMFWATVAYCYGFMLASSVMLAAHTLSLGNIFKQQAWIIIVATLAPWFTSVAYVMRLGPRPELDHTPVGFALTGVLLSWAVVRTRLFELVPVAADTLFQQSPDPALVIDPAGRLVRANDAAANRIGPAGRRIGRPASEFLAVRPGLAEAVAGALAEAEPVTVAVDQTWWTIQASRLDEAGGTPRGHLVLLRDITEQKYAELALLQAKQDIEQAAREAMAANTAKTNFLAQVSHDLRTPLHAIIGMTEVLRTGRLDPVQRNQVATIGEAGDALLRLINDLLDLSRIEAGRVDLAHKPFQLDDVLDPIADLLEPAAHRKGVAFAHWIEPGLPGGLRGDIDRLRQALFNLVGNAVKFTERGVVTVRASRAGPLLRVEITDTGRGIAPEHLPAIFKPFNRGDAETARGVEGTGLGLAITRRIAEAMGGSVSASSTVGQGSVFTLELPIVDDSATSAGVSRLVSQVSGLRVAADIADPVRRDAVVRGLRGLGADAFALGPEHTTADADTLVVEAADAEGPRARAWLAAQRVILHLAASDAKPSLATVPLRRRSLAAALLPPAPPAETPAAEAAGPRRRVLLADDNALSRRVSTAQLVQCNCDVVTVDGGLAALDRLAAEEFDVVVLDGQMPDLNGWEVAFRLRQRPADAPNTRAPVVALTADLTPASHVRWLDAGADVVLGKPVHTGKLAETLERFPPRAPARPVTPASARASSTP